MNKLFIKSLQAVVGLALACVLCGTAVWAVERADSWVVTLPMSLLVVVLASFYIVRRAKVKTTMRAMGVIYIGELVPVMASALCCWWLFGKYCDTPTGIIFVAACSLFAAVTAPPVGNALKTYFAQIAHHDELYYYLLGNGHPHDKALRYIEQRAIERASLPMIKNIGRSMTGLTPSLLFVLIMTGMPVWNAVVLWAAVLLLSLCSTVVSSLLTVWLIRRNLFNKYGQLHKGVVTSMLVIVVTTLLLSGCKENKPPKTTLADTSVASTTYDTQDTDERVARAQNGEHRDGALSRMTEIPAKLTDRPEIILRRKGFTVSYNKTTKQPNWVAWHLVKSHTNGRYKRDEQVFGEDYDVPTPRATNEDYYNSRYDRGHLCPAADNRWSEEAMAQSFLLTNICPQNHALNKNGWNDLEIECRSWARKYGAIDIVCGPIFYNKATPKTIGKHQVWVPEAFFKVVLCRRTPFKALAFVYKNIGKNQSMRATVCTIDKVEEMTGIDFFPMLEDDVESRVEAHSTLSDW